MAAAAAKACALTLPLVFTTSLAFGQCPTDKLVVGGAEGDYFGLSLAVSGNVTFVAAPYHNSLTP